MILLSKIYNVTLKRSIRNAASNNYIRPTIGQSFMSHRDYEALPGKTTENLFTDPAKCSANFNNSDAGRAVDGSVTYPTNTWYAVGGQMLYWWQYDFGEGNSHTIIKYVVETGIGNGIEQYTLHRWKFQGSNNGIDWDTLDDQSAQTYDWDLGITRREFEIDNTTSYRYYRYDIGNNDYLAHGSVWVNSSSIGITEAYEA